MVTLLPPISAMTYMFPTDRHTAIDQHDNQVVQMGHSGPATQQATQRRHQHPKYITSQVLMHSSIQLQPQIDVLRLGPDPNPCKGPKAHQPILTKGQSETHCHD